MFGKPALVFYAVLAIIHLRLFRRCNFLEPMIIRKRFFHTDTSLLFYLSCKPLIKGCVRCIFASLFCESKREHL